MNFFELKLAAIINRLAVGQTVSFSNLAVTVKKTDDDNIWNYKVIPDPASEKFFSLDGTPEYIVGRLVGAGLLRFNEDTEVFIDGSPVTVNKERGPSNAEVICLGGYYHVPSPGAPNLYQVKAIHGISFYNVHPLRQTLPKRQIIAYKEYGSDAPLKVLSAFEGHVRQHYKGGGRIEIVESLPSRDELHEKYGIVDE